MSDKITEKRWLESADAFLVLAMDQLIQNNPVRAYATLDQLRKSFSNRLESAQ